MKRDEMLLKLDNIIQGWDEIFLGDTYRHSRIIGLFEGVIESLILQDPDASMNDLLDALTEAVRRRRLPENDL